jgi:acid phosphatase
MAIARSRRRTKWLVSLAGVAVLAIVGAVGFASSATATTTVTVAASADAYVNSRQPSDNFGAADMLRVDGSPTVLSYLRFDLTGVSGNVSKAELRVYANSESAAGYQVDTTTNNWTEDTIDYQNAPPAGSTVGSTTGFGSGVWTSVDVTSAVQAGSVADFVLVDRNNTMINLAGRESSHSPVLVLTISEIPSVPVDTATPGTTETPVPPSASASGPVDTATPVATEMPAPSSAPSSGPTDVPSSVPTQSPTAQPSVEPTVAPTATPTQPVASGIPAFSHIYVIAMENHEYSSIVGSSSAPFVNSLIATYGLAANYYAVAHPSEPNYIALTSGGTQGITDDGTYNLSTNNIFAEVEASGRTWKAIMQGYPSHCYAGSSSPSVVDGVGLAGSYVRKHDPAISYTDISTNPVQCAAITNLASFDPAAANLFFIAPNLMNDMHDGSIADGDHFLAAFLPQITKSSAFANSVVFITWDEGSTNIEGGGHVVTIAITPGMTPGFEATAKYGHYSLLRTIEDAWGLPRLGASASAAPLSFPW